MLFDLSKPGRDGRVRSSAWLNHNIVMTVSSSAPHVWPDVPNNVDELEPS